MNSFNLQYKRLVEGEDRIRSIGAVPYSDFLITAPNRFEIYKLNRRTGKVWKKKSPLDSTGLIKCPVATWRHNDNPHSPTRVQRKGISDHNYKIGTDPRCVLTGYSGPTNAVIDWTTMKTVAYWNLALMGGYPNITNNIVSSMTYFGAIPSPSMYVFSTAKLDRFVYLFDTITNRKIHKYEDFQTARSREVNWINGTLYVSVYINKATSKFPGGSQLMFLKIFGATSRRAYSKSVRRMNNRDIKKYAITNVFLELGAGDELESVEELEGLDNYHLGYYILSNNLQLEPPVISWHRCQNQKAKETASNLKGNNDGRMLYGRYRNCQGCVQGFFKVNLPHDEDEFSLVKSSNQTFLRCRRKKCDPDPKTQVPRVFSIEDKISSNNGGKKVKKNKDECHVPYVLKKSEVGFANDDGCLPGFNRDYFGVCRKCLTEDAPYVANCFFFTPSTLIKEDYTMNIENYEATLFTTQFPYKGHSGSDENNRGLTYESIHFSDRNWSGVTKYPVSLAPRSMISVWKHQKTPGSELCYSLDSDPSDMEGYVALPARGFRLEPMENFPWIDTSKQKDKYPNGTLSREICVKDCPVGTYFDFGSLSCRKCAIGCADCDFFSQCKVCIPGYLEVKVPKMRELDEGVEPGSCMVGCQSGFYRKRFNGECLECPKGCEVCRDRSEAELLKITKSESEELGSTGFCLICSRGSDGKQSRLVDEVTGRCIESCSKEGQLITTRRTDRFSDAPNFEYQICSRCFYPKCKRCSSKSPDGCAECQKDYYLEILDDDSKGCKKFRELKVFKYYILGGLGVISSAVLVLLMCLMSLGSGPENSRINMKKKKNMEAKDHIDADLTSKGKFEGPFGFVKNRIPSEQGISIEKMSYLRVEEKSSIMRIRINSGLEEEDNFESTQKSKNPSRSAEALSYELEANIDNLNSAGSPGSEYFLERFEPLEQKKQRQEKERYDKTERGLKV